MNRVTGSTSLGGVVRRGVSTAAIAMMLAAPAWAQAVEDHSSTATTTGGAGQSATSATSDQLPSAGSAGDVVVTGIRASVQSSTQRKRNAEQVIDSITAQDIGALPDRSVSEALQRIAGVTLQRTNENRDPARLSQCP